MADINCDPGPSLESLPAELINQICGDISGGEHCNLLQVSKRLKDNGIEDLYGNRVCMVRNAYIIRGSDREEYNVESLDRFIDRSIPMTNGRVGPLDCEIKNLDVEIINRLCSTGSNRPKNWVPMFDPSVRRKRCVVTIRYDSHKPVAEAKKGILEFMRDLHQFEEVTLKYRPLSEDCTTDPQDHVLVRQSQDIAFRDYQSQLEAVLGPSEVHEDADVALRCLSWKPRENKQESRSTQSGLERRDSDEGQ
ncbi:MAG: hypothetical protein HETSPECPRED_002250 [Heterodermia speciosa]|uniref:Uncharacterized protein n=1 Tax=Heterodermia speciosa TaxID=116794 RepID=A0A8H3IDZ6_9LECA|nr:MAG: hypothetical protein HETSPECPRED_002250 [Heterodermia speciosa]